MITVAQAGSGEESLTLHERFDPDVTIMDLRLPGMSGVDAIRAIRRRAPNACFVVLTTSEGDEDIYRALKAGAQSYAERQTLASRTPDSDLLLRPFAGSSRTSRSRSLTWASLNSIGNEIYAYHEELLK